MINLESFLMWLGGVVFGLVPGFFLKLILQEADEPSPSKVSTLSSPEIEEEKKKSGAAPPFF
jgi:hypothetical protein